MIERSAIISLIVQVAVWFLGVFALIRVTPGGAEQVLADVLKLEMLVQTIELIFYMWLVWNILKQSIPAQITQLRYLDWSFSTPLMLVSTAVYFRYRDGKAGGGFWDVVSTDRDALRRIILSNWMMLIIGYLGESGALDIRLAVGAGTVPFLYAFWELHHFVSHNDPLSQKIFGVMFGIWSLYGIAALADYRTKNVAYNGLDVIAKNFYGLFLSIELLRLG
jgi:hypothetical protein